MSTIMPTWPSQNVSLVIRWTILKLVQITYESAHAKLGQVVFASFFLKTQKNCFNLIRWSTFPTTSSLIFGFSCKIFHHNFHINSKFLFDLFVNLLTYRGQWHVSCRGHIRSNQRISCAASSSWKIHIYHQTGAVIGHWP